MEEEFRGKMKFDETWTLMEDKHWWNTNFDGRLTLIEDDLQYKMTFNLRQPWMENNLWWKTTFDGRQPLMEDNLWWKTTFDGRHLIWKTFYQHDYLKHFKLDNDNKKFKVNEINKLSKELPFPVILDLDLKPFSKLTFAHQVLPYLEQTFT